MIDDEQQRDGLFRQLKWSLQSLARAGSTQPPLFPDQAPGADALASAFDQSSTAVRDAYKDDLSTAQEAALDAIAAMLATMSRDGTEFDAELWTEAALSTSAHWAQVRQLALSALEVFGWTVDGQTPGSQDDDPG